MNPSISRDLILSTDYGIDKVLGTFTGSFNAIQRYAQFSPRRTSYETAHSFNVACLINGVYSFDQVTWYPFGVNVADTSSTWPVFQTIEVNAYSDDTNLVVQASNWTATSREIYYACQLMSRE